jgi:hypothetical protein
MVETGTTKRTTFIARSDIFVSTQFSCSELLNFLRTSTFMKTCKTKTKKGTNRQNMSQMSMNFRYAVAGST